MRLEGAVALRVVLCVALCVGHGMALSSCDYGHCERDKYRSSGSTYKFGDDYQCKGCQDNSAVRFSDFAGDLASTVGKICPDLSSRYGNSVVKHCCKTQEYCLCNMGYYQTDSLCTLCAQGKYNDKYGVAACTPCPAGHWSPPGASSCGACSYPYFVPVPTQTGAVQVKENAWCAVCDGGHVNQNDRCDPCPRDHSSSNQGQSCDACGHGYGTTYEATTNCQACPLGKVSFHASNKLPSNTGLCYQCQPSYYPNTEKYACLECDTNTYAKPGHAECTRCDDDMYRGRGGSMTECCKNISIGTLQIARIFRRPN